jgi:phosphodiesterase/alkaline phosphatase D-like protein
MIPMIRLFLAVFALAAGASAQYLEVGPFSGAVTDSSAVVVYKVSLPDQDCRVEYAMEASMEGSRFSATRRSSAANANYVKVRLEDLEPETTYHFRLELNGEIVERSRGKFRTFARSAKSFRFAFGNSLKSESRRSGMRASLDEDILFFLNTGDIHYDDIDVPDLGRFRNSYQKAFLRRDMTRLGRSTPLVFIWDDHDYGPNNSDRTAPGRLQSGRAYRECIPHYPLPARESNGAIYQAFSVNETRVVMTDLRSRRDPNKTPDSPEKSMMGKEQLAWFLDEIRESAATHRLVIWGSSVPYTAEKREGGDHWGGFTHERRTIANFLKENEIENLLIVSGDAHSVLCNLGTGNNYSDYEGDGLFEVLTSPLDNWATSVKGGPWSKIFVPEPGQLVYGLLEVDYGDDATTVIFKAFDTDRQMVMRAEKTFPFKTDRRD